MVEGVQGATELLGQAISYLAYQDRYFATMFTIIIVVLVIMFFINKFRNTD